MTSTCMDQGRGKVGSQQSCSCKGGEMILEHHRCVQHHYAHVFMRERGVDQVHVTTYVYV